MIIVLLIVVAILFFLAWNLVNKQPLHFILNTIMTVLLLVVMGLSVGNFKYHYGMHKVTSTTTSTKVSSLSSEMNMVISQPVGESQSKDKALVYKSDSAKKTIKPDTDVTNLVVSSNIKHAKLVTKTVRWEYKNSFQRFMYGLAQKESIYHRTNTLYVPKSWLVLNGKQVKALPTIMKQEQANMQKQAASSQSQQQAMLQQEVQSMVQQKVAQAKKQNPNMTASQQQALVKKATAEAKQSVQAKAQQAALAKMMPNVKAALAKVK
ncbi:DUF4811 domain-containing protein [Nicoliella lavandulae]|uniref:DUF4811 domain-containing protein n=1 Tax=Nicoliella lavandulae TaxID=3082954 RepID=A0ABU8SJR7_9LACO